MSKTTESDPDIEIVNPECLRREEIEDIGILASATVLVTSSSGRTFHVPRKADEWDPVCPNEPMKGTWNDKDAGQVDPVYEICSRCAQYLGVHGNKIALEPEKIFLEEEGVIYEDD